MAERPFRSPHHTASEAGLIGGGPLPHPGEVSLAHHGVLFLDELPEFSRRVLEALRQPLEDGRVVVSRAAGNAAFPARFQLVVATNPCPCGQYGVPGGSCECAPQAIRRYTRRLSGPLLDRIDIDLRLQRVSSARSEDTGTMTTARGRTLMFAMFVNNVPLPKGVEPSREGKVLGKLCEVVYQHAP